MIKIISDITLLFGSTNYKGNLTVNTNQHTIDFKNPTTKEPIAVITKLVPGLQSNEFAIKNYSENEGVYPQLVGLKIIEPAHRYHSQGYVTFPICKLAINEP